MPFKQRKKQVPVKNALGEQIGVVEINDTRRRWRALFWWIVIFTLVVFFALSQNRHQSDDIRKSKADVNALLISNCNTRLFIVSAGQARKRILKGHLHELTLVKGKAKSDLKKVIVQDKASIRTANQLANNFAKPGCAKRLGIKQAKQPKAGL